MKKLSVLIPAFLEEENLRILLPRLNKVLHEMLGEAFEVLILDTMDPLDGTKQVCLENGVSYVNRIGGNSYGSAIRTGISKATGELILFMDADGSHRPEFIPDLFRESVENDIVIASRYIDGGCTENKKSLVLMSRIVNWGFSIVLGVKCADMSNSFKLYKSSLIKGKGFECDNFDIVEEVFLKSLKSENNVSFKEIPFTFRQRMFGESKRNLIQFVFSYVKTLVRLKIISLKS